MLFVHASGFQLQVSRRGCCSWGFVVVLGYIVETEAGNRGRRQKRASRLFPLLARRLDSESFMTVFRPNCVLSGTHAVV